MNRRELIAAAAGLSVAPVILGVTAFTSSEPECARVVIPDEWRNYEFSAPGDPRTYRVSDPGAIDLLRKIDKIAIDAKQLGDDHETRVANYDRFRDWWRAL